MIPVSQPAEALLGDLLKVVPVQGPMRLDAQSLATIERIETEYRFPVVDFLDSLRYETPRTALQVRNAMLVRAAYALGKADAELGRVCGEDGATLESLADAVRRCLEAAASDQEAGPTAAFQEGVLDGLASLVLERLATLPEVELVVVPGQYVNDIDLAVRFSSHAASLTDLDVEALLRSAKDHFSALVERFLAVRSGVPYELLAEIAVRRVEIALVREEAEARAEDNLRRRIRAALKEGHPVHVALHRARNAPEALPREKLIALPSHRFAVSD